MNKKVIVIGGGIIGLSTAYYLTEKGHEVVVLDKSDFTAGASYVNAGYLTPSHFIPLAAPGVVKKGLKWMLNPASPFYMKPQLNLAFLKWLWYFNKSATRKKVEKSIAPLLEINLKSRDLYHEMAQNEALGAFQLERKGILMLHKTNKEQEIEGRIAMQAIDLGLEVKTVDKKTLEKMEPGVKLDVEGAYLYLCDGHMTPGNFMRSLKDYLIGRKVRIIANEEVIDFNVKNNRIASVVGRTGEWSGDEYVLAAGSWSSNLSKKIGTNVLLQAGKGYCIDCYESTGITMPAILSEAKVAVTPMEGFTRFAGTMEFSGINKEINHRRVEAIRDAVNKYYPDVRIPQTALDNARSGLRPVTPDGLPYIGRTSRCHNLLLATGHAMMGWCLGPATGQAIAELISGDKTSIDIRPYDPERRF